MHAPLSAPWMVVLRASDVSAPHLRYYHVTILLAMGSCVPALGMPTGTRGEERPFCFRRECAVFVSTFCVSSLFKGGRKFRCLLGRDALTVGTLDTVEPLFFYRRRSLTAYGVNTSHTRVLPFFVIGPVEAIRAPAICRAHICAS